MRRRTKLAIAATAAVAPFASAGGFGLAAASAPGSAEAQSTSSAVVSVERDRPARRKIVKRSFTPWARPSPRQVREIIRSEARRWSVAPSRLARRIGCESTFRWWASNGSFQGLLQFHPGTFHRGLGSIRTRRVVLRREDSRRVHEARIKRYADGRVIRRRGRAHRQRVVRIYTGTLPRRPGVTHGWTQVRIGAQALRGISAVRSSEWGCPA